MQTSKESKMTNMTKYTKSIKMLLEIKRDIS